ncbi:GNAT family N-acetyltransferase [Jiangella aurantiaca]|uniref:GNAT family N-acetyltransferase n=1 Tax=Jiangella aurantiaca TaxID=2530373 RepID=A0A4V2YRW3_9ACTN|nr:GNAT family N-acetyltransferase [Jiangella aurantiaca]TDD67947.1 GNAT family N-acetyltransferase [Jiangella aurantiaca]
MIGTSTAVRPLSQADLDDTVALLDRDPCLDVFVGSRVHASGLAPSRLAGELWGYYEDQRLRSLCYSGANLVPVAASARAARTFADLAVRRGRRCSSIVGPADAVLSMWDLLRPEWGPAREVRACQPVMAISSAPVVPADPLVRRVRPDEIDVLLPAAIAMFTEEVGVSPTSTDGGAYYKARLTELVRAGRAFARFEDGEIVFKAEIGAVTPHACQVQGVWVRPERRGERLSVGGMAAVVEYALREIAPAVTLYVNDFNVAARGAYRRVGFTEVGRFATIMF